MIIVTDANVLLRFVDTTSGQHSTASTALSVLKTQGHSLRTLPQSFYEFWVVATRPVANNGLGFSTARVDSEITSLKMAFPMENDMPGLFPEWRALVVAHDCKGKVAHDARLVAAMRTHAIAHILTFNVADFARFPGLTILDPAVVVAGSTIPP